MRTRFFPAIFHGIVIAFFVPGVSGLNAGAFEAAGEIRPAWTITQTFTVPQPNFDGISLGIATYARVNNCTLRMELLSLPERIPVAALTLHCAELEDNAAHVLRFEAIYRSQGKRFELDLRSDDGAPGNGVTVWIDPSAGKGETLRVGGITRPGSVKFDLTYAATAPEVPLGEIVKGVVIKQTWIGEHPFLKRIDLPVENFGRSNDSLLSLEFREDASGKFIVSQQVDCLTLFAGEPLSYGFMPQPFSQGRKYTLTVYSQNAVTGTGVRLIGRKVSQPNETLSINDKPQEGGVVLQAHYTSWSTVGLIGALALLAFILTAAHVLAEKRFARAIKVGLMIIIVSSIVYVIAMMQYAAITVPHWDHCELARLFILRDEGQLNAANFLAPHNHARPLTYRLICYFNGLLTSWDIRSEYIYLALSLVGAFALIAFALRRMAHGKWRAAHYAILAIFSILIFSPAGHYNHWWSVMLMMTLSALFIHAAFLYTGLASTGWSARIITAAFCWLAAYSVTNGLVAFGAAALHDQYASGRLFRFTRGTLFWVLNLAALSYLYLPGLSEGLATPRAAWGDTLWYAIVYLGAPLWGILRFPYPGMIDLPHPTTTTGLVGLLLLGIAAGCILRYRNAFERRSPGARLFVVYVAFAIGSALLTARGRAGFADGIVPADASRYTLFSSYMLYGFLFLIFEQEVIWIHPPDSHSQLRRLAASIGFVCFLGLAARSYYVALRIYEEVHKLNRVLMSAYREDGLPTPVDKYVYPSQDFVNYMRSNLLRMKMGPYAGTPPPK